MLEVESASKMQKYGSQLTRPLDRLHFCIDYPRELIPAEYKDRFVRSLEEDGFTILWRVYTRHYTRMYEFTAYRRLDESRLCVKEVSKPKGYLRVVHDEHNITHDFICRMIAKAKRNERKARRQ